MGNTEKPRIAEALGVDGKFSIKYGKLIVKCYIGDDGVVKMDIGMEANLPGFFVCYAINHPESIIRPGLTEEEMTLCKAMGAKYAAHSEGGRFVNLYTEKPDKDVYGIYPSITAGYIGGLDEKLFPSVRPGACICVETD